MGEIRLLGSSFVISKRPHYQNLGVSTMQVKKTGAGEKTLKLAHTKTGEPVLDEKVDLAEHQA